MARPASPTHTMMCECVCGTRGDSRHRSINDARDQLATGTGGHRVTETHSTRPNMQQVRSDTSRIASVCLMCAAGPVAVLSYNKFTH